MALEDKLAELNSRAKVLVHILHMGLEDSSGMDMATNLVSADRRHLALEQHALEQHA